MGQHRYRSALLLAAEYPPYVGGVASYSRSLAEGLTRIGIDVRVVSSTPARGVDGASGPPVTRTWRLLDRKYVKIMPLLFAGLAACVRQRPDIVILTKVNHEGVVGMVLRRLFGTPYIVVGHGLELLQFGTHPIFGRFVRTLLKRALHVIANSTYTAELMTSLGAASSRISVVHPVVDVPRLSVTAARSMVDGTADRRMVLTVARLVPRKGHDRVIEAIAHIQDEFPGLLYIIAGDGPERDELEALVRTHGLEEQVRLVGQVSDEERERLFAECELFVMASRREGSDIEGFGIVFVEAAMRGKPVIAGRSGGVPDAVVDGVTGILVDPTNADEIANAFRSLLRDPTMARSMGERGRARALSQFTREQQSQRLRDLFDSLPDAPERRSEPEQRRISER